MKRYSYFFANTNLDALELKLPYVNDTNTSTPEANHFEANPKTPPLHASSSIVVDTNATLMMSDTNSDNPDKECGEVSHANTCDNTHR